MRIVEADATFLEQWLSLRQMLWEHPLELHVVEAEKILATDLETAFLLLDDDNQILGFIEGALYLEGGQKYGYVEGWFVHPDFRQKGYGGLLQDALEEWFLHRSIALVLSDTIPEKYPISARAHHRHGFKDLMTIQVFTKSIGKDIETDSED